MQWNVVMSATMNCWRPKHALLPPALCALAFVSVLPVSSIRPGRPAPCSDCSFLDAFSETALNLPRGAALLGNLSLLAVSRRFLASLVAQWERIRLSMQET